MKVVGIVNVHMTCTQCIFGHRERKEIDDILVGNECCVCAKRKFSTNREICIHEDRQSSIGMVKMMKLVEKTMHEDVQVRKTRTHNSGASIGATAAAIVV